MLGDLSWSIKNLRIDTDNDGKISSQEKKVYKQILGEGVSQEELSNEEKQKRREILDRIMEYNFDINHWLRFEVINKWETTIYESLDQHSPTLTQKDFSEKLDAITRKYRNEMSDMNADSESGETPENLKLMVLDYFKENKESLWKFGISDIRELTPQQAAKLASIIVMDKLDYDYLQFLVPSNEKDYLKWLKTEEESNQYNKSKEYSISFAYEIVQFLKQHPEIKSRKEISNEVLKNIWKSIKDPWYTHLSQDIRDEIMKNNIDHVDFVYKQVSSLFKEHLKNDDLPVDELLKKWKGVCRNYGIATEKIFDALKDIQNTNNNLLKNSALVRFVDVKNVKGHYETSSLMETWINELKDSGFSDHMWNLLVTIDENGTIHKTQLDPTQSDWWDGSRNTIGRNENIYGKVKTLDTTYERLLQDLTKEWSDSKEVTKNLVRLYVSLDKTSINEDMEWNILEKIKIFFTINQLDRNIVIEEIWHTQYARLLFQIDKYSESRSEFKQVLTMEPTNWRAYYHIAIIDFQDQKYESCTTYFQEAIKFAPAERKNGIIAELELIQKSLQKNQQKNP